MDLLSPEIGANVCEHFKGDFPGRRKNVILGLSDASRVIGPLTEACQFTTRERVVIEGACIHDREINCQPTAQFRNGVLISLRFEIEGFRVGSKDAQWDNLPRQRATAGDGRRLRAGGKLKYGAQSACKLSLLHGPKVPSQSGKNLTFLQLIGDTADRHACLHPYSVCNEKWPQPNGV